MLNSHPQFFSFTPHSHLFPLHFILLGISFHSYQSLSPIGRLSPTVLTSPSMLVELSNLLHHQTLFETRMNGFMKRTLSLKLMSILQISLPRCQMSSHLQSVRSPHSKPSSHIPPPVSFHTFERILTHIILSTHISCPLSN
jgi:hypothetical protein